LVLTLPLEEQVQFIRELEVRIADEYPKGEMRCPVHLSIGQEAAAVGVMSQLSKQDLVVSTHRSHAHYLAKGGDPYRMLSELYGKRDGCSRGQGGSMHLVDWDCGFAGSTSIVGGTIPIGVGLAFALKYKREDKVVAVCLGDAALEEGVFHESANFASLHKLPVIFVVENNGKSCYTDLKDRQPDRPFTYIAGAHDLNYTCSEDDLNMIKGKMVTAINCAKTVGPVFFEIKTERLVEHCGPTTSVPRTDKFKTQIDELFDRVKACPYPDEAELGRYLYA
jgi:pyruvate dehydrogenase E1 component alpha subunit